MDNGHSKNRWLRLNIFIGELNRVEQVNRYVGLDSVW